MTDNTVSDFAIGDVIQHIFHGRYATIVKVGRKYIHCEIHCLEGQAPVYRWLPTSVRLVTKSCDYAHTYDVG